MTLKSNSDENSSAIIWQRESLSNRAFSSMSLIEYLEHDNWQEVLGRSFTGAIVLLQTDRFRMTSSAIDDVRSWLTSGGVIYVQQRLDRQMNDRRIPDHRQIEIRVYLEQLVQENRRDLLKLMTMGITPENQSDFLATCGISDPDFQSIVQQISAGENPFESWMTSNGYSQETIDQIYQIIDRWLVQAGLRLPAPPIDPNSN